MAQLITFSATHASTFMMFVRINEAFSRQVK